MERAQEGELATAEGRDKVEKEVEARLEEGEEREAVREGGEEVEGPGEELIKLIRFKEEELDEGGWVRSG